MSELDEKKSLEGKEQNKGLEALKDLKSEVTKESNIEAITDKKDLIKEIKTETKKESSEEKK